MNTSSPTPEQGNTPVAEVRIGSIKAAIWMHTTDQGRDRFSVGLTRSYKDERGDWHETKYLNTSDLLTASKVLDGAHTRVLDLMAQRRQEAREQQAV